MASPVDREMFPTASRRSTASTPGQTRLKTPFCAMCCGNRIVYFRNPVAEMTRLISGTFRHWPTYCRVPKAALNPCFMFETLIDVFIFI
jgi:hypothetical protein